MPAVLFLEVVDAHVAVELVHLSRFDGLYAAKYDTAASTFNVPSHHRNGPSSKNQ